MSTTMTTAEYAERCIAMAKKHPAWWMSVFSKILDKQRQIITPKLNIFQIRLFAAYDWCMANLIPPRLYGVKSRQVGGSSAAAGLMVHHSENYPTNGIFIADTFDRSDKLFAIAERFTDLDRMDWGHKWAWTMDLASSDFNSQFEKKTAEKPTASRAATLQALHMSELAFWKQGGAKDAKETMTALMNSLADHPKTLAIKESTPKGAYGVFAEGWKEAIWPPFETYWHKWETPDSNAAKTDSQWYRVFSAWWEHAEYQGDPRRPLTKDDEDRIMSKLSEREQAGIKLYKWTFPQIAWRRWCIKNKCESSEVKFDEEYPEDPHRCWQASGSPRFHHLGLAFMRTRAGLKTPEVGCVDIQKDNSPVWRRDSQGWAHVWDLPQEGFRYLISVDTAEDEDVSPTPENVDRDRHSVQVWRASTQTQKGVFYRRRLVARVKPPCRVSLSNLMDWVDALSRMYGRCIMVPEINKNGAFIVKEAKRRGIPLYRTRMLDPITDRPIDRYGFLTDEGSRIEAIEELALGIREAQDGPDGPNPDGIEVFCQHFIEECSSFMINKKGKPEAASGKHDDDVIGGAIAIKCMDAATEYVIAKSRVTVRDLSGNPMESQTPGSGGRVGKW